MAKLSVDDILDAIKELSVIEAADLSKKIEEEFGIQAAAPVAVAGVAAGGGAVAEEPEEQTEFSVVLTAAGDKKIQVIKEVRALTTGPVEGWGPGDRGRSSLGRRRPGGAARRGRVTPGRR